MNEKLNEIKHRLICSEPKQQADLDKMEAAYMLFVEATSGAIQTSECLVPIDGQKLSQLTPGVHLMEGPKGPTTGYVMCTHCMARASMYMRDAANVLDDLVKEAEKHITKEG